MVVQPPPGKLPSLLFGGAAIRRRRHARGGNAWRSIGLGRIGAQPLTFSYLLLDGENVFDRTVDVATLRR